MRSSSYLFEKAKNVFYIRNAGKGGKPQISREKFVSLHQFFKSYCIIPFLGKNRVGEAEDSLAWYRGWTSAESIKTEFHSICDGLQNTSTSVMDTSYDGNITKSKKSRLQQVLRPYLQRSFYIPLGTIFCIMVVHDFCGTQTVKVFSTLIFKKIESPIDEYTATTILFAARLTGATLFMFLICLTGRRNLLFATLTIVGVSYTIAATFSFLTYYGILVSEVYFWFAPVFIILAIFSSATGIDKIAQLINGEIFPVRHRYIGAGMGIFISHIFSSVINKMFLYLVGIITISGTFIIFALTNIIGCITLYFILPDTEDMTLNEIEGSYTERKTENKEELNFKKR